MFCRVTMGAVLALTASAALAHTGTGTHVHAGFLAGLTHPFTGADHLAAMVTLGLWSALALRPIWMAPLAFVLMLLAGALAGMAGVGVPAVEPMIAASVLALGLMVAWQRRWPLAAAMALSGVFAFFHGVAHGAELVAGPAWAALAGMVLGTALLHGAGLWAGHRWLARTRVARWGVGGGMALLGLALLVRA